MDRLKFWIRNNQLVAFFCLTLILSWGLGFSFYLVFQDGYEFLFPISAVAICAPALTGIIISRLCDNEPGNNSKQPFWRAFVIALAVSSVIFLANNVIINRAVISPIMMLFTPIVVSPVAYVFGAAFSRFPTVRRYLSTVFQVRFVWGWLLLAPVVLLGLNLLSIWFSNLLGRQTVQLSNLPFKRFDLVKVLAISFLYQIFFFNLSGEEVGWRGFTLPRLLAQTNPIIASMVLTFFWAIYHAFYWGALGDPVMTTQYWIDTFIRLFPATVIISCFYIHSKGSILVAGITHAAANTFFTYLPGLDWPVHTATIYGFSLVIIILERWWEELPDSGTIYTHSGLMMETEDRV